jgi:Leucine-rich repeat (LRR) protein
MRIVPLLLPSFLAANAMAAGITLAEYARGRTIPIYTVGSGAAIPLAGSDNTNNLLDGDKVLMLSRVGLTSIDGISRLRVVDEGREKALSEVERLRLYLNENAIRVLPPELFTLQKLEFLYLYYNRLDAIPPQIAALKGLLGMYFTGNNISAIPPEVFTMTKLRKLQVNQTKLTEAPAALCELTELRHLNLAANAIETLPECIGRLTKLRVCDFSDNRIARLPESFGAVPIVHQLRICNNPLRGLPAGFAAMPGSIDITGTQIELESLPPALRSKISREKVTDKPKKTKPATRP